MQSIEQLLTVVKQLRDPLTGCEWDRVQTFDSIKGNTLEESYEVLQAIEQKNFPELKTELGDLLFQILLYAQMAEEQQHFSFDDICNTLKQKLISRHPHIFGEQKTAKINWEVLKQKERDQKQQYSILDDIPQALPALMRAEKIQKRCASVGFDWQTLPPVIDKVKEEIDEVLAEINCDKQVTEKIEEEVGDLLFSVVNLTRHLGFNAELTLNKASQKFERRFRQVENIISKQGHKLNEVTLDEMEQAWQQVKRNEP
ncbi:nucleoside triphosphate pyrophosphohydrolase [Orbus wheelerorum]|uniref:nucleoside triphosphate pyrophosphohydrolase n=1 Tax=Orbus wheelerorum TaxID=3074111 RepID=UPI00370D45AA